MLRPGLSGWEMTLGGPPRPSGRAPEVLLNSRQSGACPCRMRAPIPDEHGVCAGQASSWRALKIR